MLPRSQRIIDCDLFVSLAIPAVMEWTTADDFRDHDDTLITLMERMGLCAAESLSRGWLHCGSGDDTLMTKWIVHSYHLLHPSGQHYIHSLDKKFPHDMVRSLLQGKRARVKLQ